MLLQQQQQQQQEEPQTLFVCNRCKNTFTPVNFKSKLLRVRQGKSIFCSRMCQYVARRKPLLPGTCHNCHKDFWMRRAIAVQSKKRNGRVFCSHRCAGHYYTQKRIQEKFRRDFAANADWLTSD
jgi:hypothetical protein